MMRVCVCVYGREREKIYIIIIIIICIGDRRTYLLWRKSMMINIQHMFLYSSHSDEEDGMSYAILSDIPVI